LLACAQGDDDLAARPRGPGGSDETGIDGSVLDSESDGGVTDLGTGPVEAGPTCTPEACGANGVCIASGACFCQPGYVGAACDGCAPGFARAATDAGPGACEPTNVINGTENAETLTGTPGPDKITCFAGDDVVRAGAGDDLVFGNVGADQLFGEDGNDLLYGGMGKDRLFGGPGNDFLYGQVDDDELEGQAGNDLLSGGPGNDLLRGGLDDDVYLLDGQGDDRIDEAGGIDAAICAPGVTIASERREGDDLIWTFTVGGAAGGTVRVIGQFEATGAKKVETVLRCK
jgi:hypothetical protein